jgi:hypothetical protein
MYPSPESALMKTIAVAAALAADAPEDVVSVFDNVTVVPSVAAWLLIASYGAVRYWMRLEKRTRMENEVPYREITRPGSPTLEGSQPSVIRRMRRTTNHSQSASIAATISARVCSLRVDNCVLTDESKAGRFIQRKCVILIFQENDAISGNASRNSLVVSLDIRPTNTAVPGRPSGLRWVAAVLAHEVPASKNSRCHIIQAGLAYSSTSQ